MSIPSTRSSMKVDKFICIYAPSLLWGTVTYGNKTFK